MVDVARPRSPRAFAPRPVVYRTTDFRTNEFRGLTGGEAYEPVEDNPMIGYRGCYRYVQDPTCSRSSWRRWRGCASSHPNLHLMIPFVRTRWELEACLTLVDASPLGRQRGLHRWVMAEVPSVVHWLPEYIGMGIDGVSIGSNDLTQLMLGVDRDSGCLRGAVRRVRPGRARRHRPDHRHRTQVRDHVVAVRAGAVDQAGLRRTPGADGHHVGVGEP